ncbi:MAG: FliO/MopB family protein [Actinobacteria bacterium]|nr:FliO/MopB family protein [Actinomycetota bacterium]
MSREAITPFLYRVAAGAATRDSWRRALVGLALLALLMAAVSLLSARMKGGESAARALGGVEDGESAAGERDAVGAGEEGEMADAAEGDPAPRDEEPAAEGESAIRSAVDNEPGDLGGEARPGGSREAPSLDLGGSLLKVFLGLAAVIVLIAVVRLLAARKSGRKGGLAPGRLEVVGYTPLGPASGIYEVRAGNRVLMVGEAEKGLSLLGEVDAESLVRAEDAELLEDEFLALIREEMASPSRTEQVPGRRPLLEELKWKTARKRGRARR